MKTTGGIKFDAGQRCFFPFSQLGFGGFTVFAKLHRRLQFLLERWTEWKVEKLFFFPLLQQQQKSYCHSSYGCLDTSATLFCFWKSHIIATDGEGWSVFSLFLLSMCKADVYLHLQIRFAYIQMCFKNFFPLCIMSFLIVLSPPHEKRNKQNVEIIVFIMYIINITKYPTVRQGETLLSIQIKMN